MCMSSAVLNNWPPITQPMRPLEAPVQRHEIDAMRREIAELKELIKAANKFDAATGQPDCEHADKVAAVRRIADLVGVSMDDVFGPAHAN